MRKQQRRVRDLVGKVFGRLLVTGFETGRYVCNCTCGGTKNIVSKSLTSGATQSCGCLQKERVAEVNALRPHEALYKHFLRTAVHQNWEVEFTYEDFLDFTETRACHYCLSEISWSSRGRYNLDRKNSNMGYTKDNTVVCCKRCNAGKSCLFTYSEWWMMTECFRKERA